MAACTVCQVHALSMQTVDGSSGTCQGGRRAWQPAVAASRTEITIQRSGSRGDCPSSSSCGQSATFGRFSSNSFLLSGNRGLHYSAAGKPSRTRIACSSRFVICETAVKIGDTQASGTEHEGIKVGDKIRVKKAITVYHVSKAKNLNIEGLEGEVIDVLLTYNGKPISATFPIKTQFFIEADGKEVKFLAHLKPDEVEVIE